MTPRRGMHRAGDHPTAGTNVGVYPNPAPLPPLLPGVTTSSTKSPAVRPPGRKKSSSASAGTEGSRRGSRVTFGAAAVAATVLQVPGVCEPRPGSPRSAPSSSPRSSSPQSPTHVRSGSVSFAIEPCVVNGYDADADDEDDADSPKCGAKDAAR
ncbi:hypothetical protein MTO96_025156 [Rhipicephalus appendiculatus]